MNGCHVFLIPGFFGFADIGELRYFGHVKRFLPAALARLGLEARLHEVPTLPTASIQRRAALLLETIAAVAGNDGLPLHLIGHSTGGLDSRLLLQPGVKLPTTVDPGPLAKRVRSVVAVSCPHSGTPLAALFTGLLGSRLLELLSAATIHSIRLGWIPLPTMLLLAESISHPSSLLRLRLGIVERAIDAVLDGFSPEIGDPISRFLTEVKVDRALLVQLSPESMGLWSAGAASRPGVRLGCVVTRARPPTLRRTLELGIDPVSQASYALFRTLHRITSGMPASALPQLEPAANERLARFFGDEPGPADNDGIVPTLSQVHGEIVHAAWADHLDAIGHFGQPGHDPPHVDWLCTATDFRRQQFEELWDDVAAFLAAGG